MAGLSTTDKALTFSYLKYLSDLCTSGKLSEESSEGLGGCHIIIEYVKFFIICFIHIPYVYVL